MKVLMINTVPTEKNGITGVVMNLIQHINHSDLQIDLLCINDPKQNYINLVTQCGGNVYKIHRSITHAVIYIKELSTLIKKNKYDIVHAHGNSHTIALELLAAKLAGCKIRIAHSHSTSCVYKSIHRILSGVFFGTYTYGIACGKEAGEWLFGNREFTIINNGIDLSKFAFDEEKRCSIRIQFGLSEKSILIGHVGDFHTDNKNQILLVQIVETLHKLDPRFQLLLIGGGKLKSEIVNLVESKNLNDFVHFTGIVENVNEYLNAFDMFLLPSKFEGLPLTAVEAQASGLLCLLSNNISAEADISGNVKFLPIDEGTQSWIESILSHSYSTENRLIESQKSIEKIAQRGFDLEKECNKLKKIYTYLEE